MKLNQDTHSISRYEMHRNKLAAKNGQLGLLKGLYEEWLPFKDEDDPYMQHLRRRIKVIENQLRCMRP